MIPVIIKSARGDDLDHCRRKTISFLLKYHLKLNAMKKTLGLLMLLFTILAMGQHTADKRISITEHQPDDIYLAGNTIRINAIVEGDVVAAGRKITVTDSVQEDLIVAGADINVRGAVRDDIRAAGGRLIIDSEISDDVILAGGEVTITEDAVIHGDLINFSGNIEMNGEVKGMLKSYSGELVLNGKVGEDAYLNGGKILINGEISGASRIAAEDIEIGSNARFLRDVEYWSEDSEINFNNSLINSKATYNEDLIPKKDPFPWEGFGVVALGLWVFYVISAFLILVLLNWAFNDFFANTVANLDKELLNSFIYGLIYLLGMPLLIVLTFILVVGIPIGLFLLVLYIFSILFGHLVAALLMAHYLNKDRNWNFWTIVFVSIGIAIVLRLLTLIPFLGGLVSIVVIAIAYGLFFLLYLQKRKNKLKIA
jgi:cytoskeletal protein CcmA (bactofilin family)